MFARVDFDVTDNVNIYAKALFNNRVSRNQAAPEPIFVGPVCRQRWSRRHDLDLAR